MMMEFRRWIFFTFVAVGGVGPKPDVLLFEIQDNSQSTAKPSASSQSKAVDLSAGLQDAAQKFLAVIERGEPLDLVNFWSDSGVVLGVDSEDKPVSKAVVREQIRKKRELYCSFFDSECLTKLRNESRRKANGITGATPDYSYRDLLLNARSKTVRVSARREGEAPVGYVTVRIENGEVTKSSTKTELDFTFVFEAGGWKLAEVPQY
jgi:hypothetical protein